MSFVIALLFAVLAGALAARWGSGAPTRSSQPRKDHTITF